MRDTQGLCTTDRYERPYCFVQVETYMHDKQGSVIIHDSFQIGDSVRYIYPWTSFLFVLFRVWTVFWKCPPLHRFPLRWFPVWFPLRWFPVWFPLRRNPLRWFAYANKCILTWAHADTPLRRWAIIGHVVSVSPFLVLYERRVRLFSKHLLQVLSSW